MKQRSVLAFWLVTLLLIPLAAGISWLDVTLSPASGGQVIGVTGFKAFPIIGALILLQAASFLAAIFTPAAVSKAIAVVQVPIVAWHLFMVLTSILGALESTVSAEITRLTGVVGVDSQAQLIELTASSNLWYVYCLALALNLIALFAFIFARSVSLEAKAQPAEVSDAGELWESQN